MPIIIKCQDSLKKWHYYYFRGVTVIDIVVHTSEKLLYHLLHICCNTFWLDLPLLYNVQKTRNMGKIDLQFFDSTKKLWKNN